MKALVVGCGSIGKTHTGNLLQMDAIDTVTVCTGVKNCLEGSKILEGLPSERKVRVVESLDGVSCDFAIIANETHRHLDTAVALAERGISLLIEKPLSHRLEGVERLKEVVGRRGLKVCIGYNLRFLGALGLIRQHLLNGALGDLYFAKIEVGQFLPDWRGNRDYRDSYSARKERGGGVGLDLSHEIDYMRYLFGDPHSWKVVRSRVSDLEIDSDDLFEGIYEYQNGFVCNVHMDYLQHVKRREMRVVGRGGALLCDFVRKDLRILRHHGAETVIRDEDLFDLKQTYRDELQHFIESVKEGTEPCVTLEDGIKVLKLLEDGHV